MKKIFTFLCAALMSVSMFATTVTWDNSTLSSIYLHGGDSFTKDGVTLTELDGMIDGRNFMGFSNDASFKFSTSLGNFTKIEITGNINALGGSGWTQTITGAVWTGEANETTFGMSFDNVSQIVFTIEEPAPTTYTLKLVADPTMGSVAVTNLLGSGIVDNGNGNYTVPENAKVTILATPNEGYVFTGWLEGNVLCDFIDCGTAINTLDNPLTFTLTQDAACKAEFAAAAPTPVGNLKLIEFQVPASWENDNTPISITDFPDFVATTYEIASALPVTSEPSLVVFDFPEIDEMSVYTKLGGQVSDPSTGTIVRKNFFEQQTQIHYYYPVLEGGEPEPAGVENVQTNHVQATKFFRDGMLLIERDGKIFNVTGVQVR